MLLEDNNIIMNDKKNYWTRLSKISGFFIINYFSQAKLKANAKMDQRDRMNWHGSLNTIEQGERAIKIVLLSCEVGDF